MTSYDNFVFTESNGTAHAFPTGFAGEGMAYYNTNSCGGRTSGSAYAMDNSGFFLSSSSGATANIVTFPSGAKQTGTTSLQLTDANGNYITQTVVSSSETDWTDSVGRTAAKVIVGSPNTTVQWIDPTGAYQTTTVKYQSFNVKTHFNCSGVVEYSGTINLPTEIDLPNGPKYLFTYESTPGYPGYTTGRIQQVTLPAGGSYQYNYASQNDGINCSDGSILGLTRTISDGTNSTQWTYSRAASGSNWVTTITSPQMPYDSAPNQSVFTFNSVNQETQEQYYQGLASGGTLLKTINKTWASGGTPATLVTVLAATTQQSEVDTTYDSNGNLTQSKEYDWGSGATGSLLRETDLTYTGAAPFRLTQKLVKDASGTVKYREDRAYDGASLTSLTGANNHDDTDYGTSYTNRGNLTALTTYGDPVTPGGSVVKNFTYNTLGNVVTAQVNCCQQKQFTYSSTNQYAAPLSVLSGPSTGTQLTKSATYNAYTGDVASTTDENGQQTSYGYDVYRRLITVTRPDGTALTTSYNDTNFTITSTTPIDSSHSKTTVVAYDGLGRPITGTVKGGSTVYSITQSQYDPLGRAYKASNPYTTSPSYWTTSEFDALGRPIASILPDGSQSTFSYSGNVLTATDPSGKQRKSYFDAPGRLTEVDEPSATVSLAPGTGSGTVSGSEQYHAATGATSGTGSVTISGSEQTYTVDNPTYDCTLYDCGGTCIQWAWHHHYTTYYDSGFVQITANGHSDSVNYGQSSTDSSVASALASAINADSSASVTASASGAVVMLTAKTTGTASNYAFSSSSNTTDSTGYFSVSSFNGTPSWNVLIGGGPATSAAYDSGSVSVTVDGNQVSVSYNSSSTDSSIASALASAINSASSMPVTASASGAGITLTASTSGAATNYSISSSSTTSQPSLFSSPSFSIPSFGPTLTGGVGPDSWSSSVSTTYTYDPLNNLTGVTQGSQTRSYTYDGMGRLTSSTTPEAGSVCIGTVSGGTCQQNGYNAYNLVATSTDARGVVTNLTYDTLNRLSTVSYNVGSTGVTPANTVTYHYDFGGSSANALGRLTSIDDVFGNGSESYTYDILGRVTKVQKVVGSNTYATQYAYNLASEVAQITYPSGRVVTDTYDSIGRLCGVGASGSTCSSGTTYAQSFNYNTAGEVTGFKYGNGVVANMSYSPDRLQLQCLQYDTTSVSNPCIKDSSALFMLTYAYGNAGANNGQISGITDGMDSGRTASYTYDGLGRLSTAAAVGSTAYPAWGLSWTYDRYGNRTAQSIISGCTGGFTCPTNSLTVSATTNQVTGTGFGYDANGNMTQDGINTLTYDAANRLTNASQGSTSVGDYVYDGNGKRVKKCVPKCSSPTTTTIYIFAGGKVLAEYDNGAAVGSPSREYIYSGGTQIAKFVGTTVTYYHQDHLSNRLVTNASGAVVGQMGHLPFGESWYDTTSGEKWKFTSYERDAESGNDYAQARYDVSRLGRFSSPDPLSGSTANPQSLNHYTYAGNDPINAIDPTGQSEMQENCGNTPDYQDPTCSNESAALNGGDINLVGGAAPADFALIPVDLPLDSSDPLTDSVDPYILSLCTTSLYGVLTTSFTPAQFGQNGSFTGIGTDVISHVFDLLPQITVIANDTTKSSAQINQDSPSPGAYNTGAYTNLSDPYTNWLRNDGMTPYGYMHDQLVELGNSLASITGKYSDAYEVANDPVGQELLNCVVNGGPGNN